MFVVKEKSKQYIASPRELKWHHAPLPDPENVRFGRGALVFATWGGGNPPFIDIEELHIGQSMGAKKWLTNSDQGFCGDGKLVWWAWLDAEDGEGWE